ncbi:MAG TPA: OmpA family protein [Caulobacteraceae bacterium]|jgi:outer membrane protein OmpA-like peptidoglycan-associated protein
MVHFRPMLGAALGALIAAGALGGAAQAQGRYDFRGGDRPYDQLRGPGVRDLLPELRDTPRGRAFVMRNFDFGHDGVITPREAREANRAFLDVAGPGDHRRFDWDHPQSRLADGPAPRRGGEDYDREGLRRYHFREGRYGAVFDLGDVLFETGSAHLKREAIEQLRPLAGYLRAKGAVRLRIDGYTDSVGSKTSNVTLSQDRAQSVADALGTMGVESRRFQLQGHGEADPKAPNTTAAGRQQNRRVEVTLVGQRASSFN